MSAPALPEGEILPPIEVELELELAERDRQLKANLRARVEQQTSGYDTESQTMRPAPEVAAVMQERYSVTQLDGLENKLNALGTLNIPLGSGSITIDGQAHTVPFVAATDTEASHGEMSSMLYLRDHIQTAEVYLELSHHDPERYSELGQTGQQLLLSALDLMSTPKQLERFAYVIEHGPAASQADWPHISLRFGDLMAEGPNNWRNIQDSWQMLGKLTFAKLLDGTLNITDLRDDHQQFLSHIVPLLRSVGFPNYPSSGSWEEFASPRTSVMAVETALLCAIQDNLAQNPHGDYAFLHNNQGVTPENYQAQLEEVIRNGLTEIGARAFAETTEGEADDIIRRDADVALAYILRYNLPGRLAAARIPIGPQEEILSEEAIEQRVLERIEQLTDPVTGGLIRYAFDSYQRTNFHTHLSQAHVAGIKLHVAAQAVITGQVPDYVAKQRLRDQLVEPGREAVWTHPLGQLAGWSARRSLECAREGDLLAAQRYRKRSTEYLNRQLSLITGENQWHAVLQPDSGYAIQPVPAHKLPECYITYRDEQGEFIVASPHTPLNWSTVSLREAIGLLRVATETAASCQLGQTSLGTVIRPNELATPAA